jgi:ATP-dependent Clp protease ATP-binding subunit ClpA
LIIEAFFNLKIKNPKIPKGSKNLADFLSFEVAKALREAKRFTRKFKLPLVNCTALFYALVKTSPETNFILFRALISPKDLQKRLKEHLKNTTILEKDSKIFEKVIEEAKKRSDKVLHKRIETGDIIYALAKNEPVFKKALIDYDLKPEDIESLIEWWESIKRHQKENKKFWEYKNLVKKGSLAKDWAAGYTITLDQYSIDWSRIIKEEGYPEIIGYKNELEQVERILSNPEINNVMIIGEPGVGMKSIIYALAKKSVLEESLPEVNNKRVVELRISSLLAQMKSLDEVEIALETIFKEVVAAGNIILVVDEFHNFVEREQKPGTIDITGFLSSFLPLPQFRFIAITSYTGLHRRIELNPSLLNFFVKVEVAEPSKEETVAMLERLVPELERRYKRYVSYPALKRIVDLSERYITSIPFPKKAKDVLDEVIVKAASTKSIWVLPEHVDEVITQKTEIPVGEIESKEREILLKKILFIEGLLIRMKQ